MRSGRGWLPWLPETAVAAADDARGVTDSWQSYRAPTRTRQRLHVERIYTSTRARVATDRYARRGARGGKKRVAVGRVTTNTHCETLPAKYLSGLSLPLSRHSARDEFRLLRRGRLISGSTSSSSR